MGNGIAGGSSIFQTIWNSYSQVAQQSTGQLVNDILPVVAVTVIGCLQLLVLITGTNLLYGKMDAGECARRIVTALVVSALMTPAVFNQYITTTLTQTIPNEITQAIVNGANGATGATGFDSLMNAITHSAAAARAQMPFPFYISERVGMWMAELAAKFLIACSFVVWALSALTVYFLVPLLAFLAPTFLFNATRSYGERWAGKIIALILAQSIALMVAGVVIKQEGVWFQQMAQNVTASANANPGFSMNAGDANFAQFADVPRRPSGARDGRPRSTPTMRSRQCSECGLARRGLRVARRYNKHRLRDRRGRRLELRPRRQPHDINRDGSGKGCRWCGNRWRGPGGSRGLGRGGEVLCRSGPHLAPLWYGASPPWCSRTTSSSRPDPIGSAASCSH